MGEDDGAATVKKRRPKKRKIVVNLQQCSYPIVSKAVKNRAGWRLAEAGEAYDLGWSDTNHMVRELKQMCASSQRSGITCPVQRVNHFPNNKQLVRKDYMAENLNLLISVAPKLYDFSPISWSLPRDNERLVKWLQNDVATNGAIETRGDAIPTYIIKPPAGLQGAGIKISQNPAHLEKIMHMYDADEGEPDGAAVATAKKMVVQLYIDRPLCIDGFKFDIRLYVLVTSIKPLKIYVFDNGLCRLCTTKYEPPTKENMKKARVHLTNFAINKTSKKFVPGENGTKRSLKNVLNLMRTQGTDTDQVWSNIIAVVAKSLIGIAPLIAQSYEDMLPKNHLLSTSTCSCFEILGYDVMIDNNLKVWLIEMNHMPSFSGSSPLDTAIKTGVVNGALDRLNISQRRKQLLTTRIKKKRSASIIQQAINHGLSLRKALPNPPASPSSSSMPEGSSSSRRLSSASSAASSSVGSSFLSRNTAPRGNPISRHAAALSSVSSRGARDGKEKEREGAFATDRCRSESSTARRNTPTMNGSESSSREPRVPGLPSSMLPPLGSPIKLAAVSKRTPSSSVSGRPQLQTGAKASDGRPDGGKEQAGAGGAGVSGRRSLNGRPLPPPGAPKVIEPSPLVQAVVGQSVANLLSPPGEISATSVSDDERQPPEAPCEKDDDDESLSNPSNLDSSSDEEEELEGEDEQVAGTLAKQWELREGMLEKVMTDLDLDVGVPPREHDLLTAEMWPPLYPTPSLDEPDTYVLVFSQTNEEHCAQYANVLQAAQCAMRGKLKRLNKHSDEGPLSKHGGESDHGDDGEEEE